MIFDPKKFSGSKYFLGTAVPILPLTRCSLGLEKLEMAPHFVCVPHCSAKELGEGGTPPGGSCLFWGIPITRGAPPQGRKLVRESMDGSAMPAWIYIWIYT